MDPVSIIFIIVFLLVGGYGGNKVINAIKAAEQRRMDALVAEQRDLRDQIERRRLELLEIETQRFDQSTHDVIESEIEKYGEAVTVCLCDWCAEAPLREAAEQAQARQLEAQAELEQAKVYQLETARKAHDAALAHHGELVAYANELAETEASLANDVRSLERAAYFASLREQAGLEPLEGQAEAANELNSTVKQLTRTRLELTKARLEAKRAGNAYDEAASHLSQLGINPKTKALTHELTYDSVYDPVSDTVRIDTKWLKSRNDYIDFKKARSRHRREAAMAEYMAEGSKF